MARLQTPNFVLRRLIFVKRKIQIYQHIWNGLTKCYSLAISARDGTYADWVRNALYLAKSGSRKFMRKAGIARPDHFALSSPSEW